MKVHEIMTKEPACCTPDTALQEVARMMVEHDCGEIPVVETKENMKPIGVVTDRDITCRVVAEGQNPLEISAGDCMTTPCITVSRDSSLTDCCNLMEKHQVRRLPVIDDSGKCCGMIAQADIAKHASQKKTAEVLKEVSQPARRTQLFSPAQMRIH